MQTASARPGFRPHPRISHPNRRFFDLLSDLPAGGALQLTMRNHQAIVHLNGFQPRVVS
jgi:hypothetical protein